MMFRILVIAIIVMSICGIVSAQEENEGEVMEIPKPLVFSKSLPMEPGPLPQSPPVEPFQRAGFTVVEASWNNRQISISRFPFQAHSLYNPRLAAFRERYDFLEHMEKGESEFEKLLLLRQWIRQRVPINFRNDTPLTDPFEILDRAARGDGFVCTQYAALMHACAMAAGWTALTVHIDHDHGKDEASTSHAVADVWVHELGKWVVFDPMYDCHYEKDGVPLSATEIQAEYIRNGGVEVKSVVGVERQPVERARRNRRMTRGEASGFFWNKYVWGYDPFIQVGSVEQDLQIGYITDAHDGREWWQGTPPNNNILHAIRRGALAQTKRLADVNPDIAICSLEIRPSEREGAVRIRVRVFMPAFESIMVSFNGAEYEPLKGESEFTKVFSFDWDLGEGENRVSVRAKNEFGMMGSPTDVRTVLRKD